MLKICKLNHNLNLVMELSCEVMMDLSDSSLIPSSMFLVVPLVVFRGSLPPEDASSCSGMWYTNEEKTASIYGNVGTYNTVSTTLMVLDIGQPEVVTALRNLFAKYLTLETDVFDSVIKTRGDNKTERNSSFFGDTMVLQALVYARDQSWIDERIAGFGSDVLPTECIGTTHHFEICFFEPKSCVAFAKYQLNQDQAQIKHMRMNRHAAVTRKRPSSKHKTGRLFNTSAKIKLTF
jgi:hypothetical protein